MLLEDGRSREELAAWLIELARETPRMVVSYRLLLQLPGVVSGGAWVRDGLRFLEACCGGAWRALAGDDVRGGGARSALLGKRPHKRPAEFCGRGVSAR